MRKEIFDDKTENTFAQINTEFSMNLVCRERAMLVLCERICWSGSVFEDVVQWSKCKAELK